MTKDEESGRMPAPPAGLFPAGWRDLSTEELVGLALDDIGRFKFVSEEIASRPPDERASERLVAARSAGAEGWFVAHLLGCVGHPAGYATAREILVGAERLMSESYAGVALARIGGEAALPDLIQLLRACRDRLSREGAAYGLAELGTPPALEAVFEAAEAGKLSAKHAGPILGASILDADRVARLFDADEEGLRLGVHIVWKMAISERKDIQALLESQRSRWAPRIRQALKRRGLQLTAYQREVLRDWVSQ